MLINGLMFIVIGVRITVCRGNKCIIGSIMLTSSDIHNHYYGVRSVSQRITLG